MRGRQQTEPRSETVAFNLPDEKSCESIGAHLVV